MRTIARSSIIKSKIKLKKKLAFDAQAFLDSAGVARKVNAFNSQRRSWFTRKGIPLRA